MSKSARPNKVRPNKARPWLKSALPWLWSDDSISKHIRYGSALVAVLVFGLGGWAATGKFVGAVITPGSVAICQKGAASDRGRCRPALCA
jgi:hypothetical protein